MSTTDSIPVYLNKSPFNLLNEVWKDIPDFERSYRASKLGRIKSLDRTIPHPRLKQQFVKGIVLSQSVSKNKNVKTGEPMIDLRVSLSIEGKQHYFNTRRIIYYTFIKRLDYNKDGLYVINIDGDGYNNSVTNLKLITKSVKQKRAVSRDRVIPYLNTADRSK
ncbi:NUMOD4 motif-containing protein [Mucilaginibacter sp. OK268]|uniref:NUMOD4 domain-containing protein n=1 Tax=Mucilaginibacter sp. OK268 TaxID=1881048 RepID=UPI0008917069|nr:NUMOD4 domain-containing protein [Mucilaginibacter sp. OK268]SDQ01644.1 NUMOD4 motif-containing protein [Mucilaginibacter sp. OK268]